MISTGHNLYLGHVMHTRLTPRRHRFRYRLSMLGLDVDQLDTAFRGRWLWSLEKPNIASFRRKDYLPNTEGTLSEAARQVVEAATGERPVGRITLMTQPRYFGLCFNPISLFFCHDESDALSHVILEVHNTPWNERHPYVLKVSEGDNEKGITFDKALHVSPFMDMDMQYRFTLTTHGDALLIGLENYRGDERLFVARMQLQAQPLNAASCRYALLATPFMTLKIVAAIYWQAMRLWLKGIRFVAHPGNKATDTPLSDATALKEEK